MYHERTKEAIARKRRHGLLAVAFVVLAIVISVFVGARVRQDAREQGATALRETILAAATRCCAVEGSYPQSLEYLEEHYGLRVNDRDYAIIYEAFATNVAPSVVVTPR